METRFVDSHCHLDIIATCNPKSVAWMRERGYLPVSWSYGGQIKAAGDVPMYLSTKKALIHRLNQEGLVCRYLAGIHPRTITPDLTADMVYEMLAPYLDDPFCLGIGEMGLETGSDREKEILEAHLVLACEAAQRGKIMGIHTPRKNKAAITVEILDMLEGYRVYGDSMVVDHCTPHTIASVLEKGFWAGVTMSPEKNQAADLLDIIVARAGDLSRIMLNTDSSIVLHRDLLEISDLGSIEEEVRTRLLRDNALKFYNLTGRSDVPL